MFVSPENEVSIVPNTVPSEVFAADAPEDVQLKLEGNEIDESHAMESKVFTLTNAPERFTRTLSSAHVTFELHGKESSKDKTFYVHILQGNVWTCKDVKEIKVDLFPYYSFWLNVHKRYG